MLADDGTRVALRLCWEDVVKPSNLSGRQARLHLSACNPNITKPHVSLKHRGFGRNNSAFSRRASKGTILRSRIFPTETEKMLCRFDFTNPRHNGRRNFRVTLTGVALGAMLTAMPLSSPSRRRSAHRIKKARSGSHWLLRINPAPGL